MKEDILHIDADAFFASCEQALDPSLKGKPVVVGKDRGIAAAMSYEAKALGVERGMPIYQIEKICPQAIILPTNFEVYSIFSRRFFDIVKKYATQVEEYSIDECFVLLSDPITAWKLKKELQLSLGITFSFGLAGTKVLSKIASKWNKPDGFTIIRQKDIPRFTKNLPLLKIWGIGSQTSAYLERMGIRTALQFSLTNEALVKQHLSKPYQEIWQELRGISVYPVLKGAKEGYRSISKTKTFTPPSSKVNFILSHFSNNIENACIKARRWKLKTKEIIFFLKKQDFNCRSAKIKLVYPTSSPVPVLKALHKVFWELYKPGEIYRATGVILNNLSSLNQHQPDFFGEVSSNQKMDKILDETDYLDERYGKHTVHLASSQNLIHSLPTLGLSASLG